MDSKIPLHTFSFEEIHLGSAYSFERLVDARIVDAFAVLSGDYNPLHTDDAYAAKTQFHGRVAHGMLLASFFSALVGMLCPGLRCLYLSQELRFKKPALLGATVVVTGTVAEKSEATKILMIKTVITNKEGVVLVEGKATVQVI